MATSYSNIASGIISDVNRVAEFLSKPDIRDLHSTAPVDCFILCASQVLYGAEIIFEVLSKRPNLTKCLVLCGGIGHSTNLLYGSVARHPRYSAIADEVKGLPEARVLDQILDRFFDREAITSQGCQILIEDQSTNCGQNALFSRRVLEQAGFMNPKTCIINQDPTMMVRTQASLEKVYEDLQSSVRFQSYPVFVPRLQSSHDGDLSFDPPEGTPSLWTVERFFELVIGEIPRLRDDNEGYGPKGRNFIAHVDIPDDVEIAWSRLRQTLPNWQLR